MNKGVITAIVIAILAATGVFVFSSDTAEAPVERTPEETTTQEAEPANPQSQSNQLEEVTVEPLAYSIDEADSIWVVVNKQRPISLEYAPEVREVSVTGNTAKTAAELSLRDEAATALEELFAAAAEENLALLLGSGYRTAELQEFYYTNYVNAYGQEEADRFSARPGTSEHQTGLGADVAPASNQCYLDTCFAETAEGVWVRDNAHAFGFIIRYPQGKESITGYQFEPWHLRYVGVDLATELFESGQTMEEYFGLVD